MELLLPELLLPELLLPGVPGVGLPLPLPVLGAGSLVLVVLPWYFLLNLGQGFDR